jgi:uncharacterized protein YdaU (DUF1376 family)
MRLYVADYLADTLHLTTAEHGAYLLLLMAMWRAGGKLPVDERKLAKIAHCAPDEWPAVRAVVIPLFKRTGGSISHKRVTKELRRYEAVVEASQKAGIASAAKKRRKSKKLASTDVQPRAHRSTNHNQTPTEEPIEGSSDRSACDAALALNGEPVPREKGRELMAGISAELSARRSVIAEAAMRTRARPRR